MIDQPTPSKTIAANVIATATQLHTLASLYMFISQLAAMPAAGGPLELKIPASGGSININSNMILPQLQAEFQRLGEELEANGIDLSAFMDKLAETWEQHNQTR